MFGGVVAQHRGKVEMWQSITTKIICTRKPKKRGETLIIVQRTDWDYKEKRYYCQAVI